MEEKEIEVDENKKKMIIEISKDEIEDNSIRTFLDDTIELDKVIEEVKKDG